MAEKGRIVLLGMEFHAHHGALDEEARLGARFAVDLELELVLPSEDRLEGTVDYSRVYSEVRDLVTGSRQMLIESLAAAIASRLLTAEPLLSALLVRVHKPHAPLPGVVRDVFVEVRRERDEYQDGS
ncbi:MAG: dihydroneopterin aldolase [Trueperaceae bacterium]